MAEKITDSPNSPEQDLRGLEQAGVEQRQDRASNQERLDPNPEAKTGERAHEIEATKLEALAEAEKSEQQKTSEKQKKVETAPKELLTKEVVEAKYQQTLTDMQSNLPSKASKAFSKVIHNPVVEKTSETIGNTIARPNLVISGAIGAIASVIIYFIARKYGYPLSGFETIGLFILGWAIGAIIEFARVGFLNKK